MKNCTYIALIIIFKGIKSEILNDQVEGQIVYTFTPCINSFFGCGPTSYAL